jgi:hypothetical protein
MADLTVVQANEQQAHFTTDTGVLFLGDNRYEDNNYVNNSVYATITLEAGTVMGRVATTRVLLPCDKDASDGSQFPVGILAEDVVLAAGQTRRVTICIYGDVNESKVKFFLNQGDLNEVVSSRNYRDRLKSDTAGIRLIASTEMSGTDNS